MRFQAGERRTFDGVDVLEGDAQTGEWAGSAEPTRQRDRRRAVCGQRGLDGSEGIMLGSLHAIVERLRGQRGQRRIAHLRQVDDEPRSAVDADATVDGVEKDRARLERTRGDRDVRDGERRRGRRRHEATTEMEVLGANLREQIERSAAKRAVLREAVGAAVDNDG